MSIAIAGIPVPDSGIARAATQLVRDTEDDLLFHHSRRVFFWGALTGERRALKYDPELLYLGAMFHAASPIATSLRNSAIRSARVTLARPISSRASSIILRRGSRPSR
jgi:hypothetical protein